MAKKILLGCIADDFTGATDLANNLVRAGMRCVQTIGVPHDQGLPEPADAVVIALKSRTVPAAQAVEQSLRALHWLQAQGAEQIYFKYCSTFDSTAQGNIGPVTDALLDALHGAGQGFTIVCPAFPVNQRTVFKGHLFVGDLLLSESSMRDHPLTPMTDANLVRVMQTQTRRKVGLVAHEHVAAGPQSIRERFVALQAAGVGVAVVDAVGDEDLYRIGQALAGMPLVTAGSGVAIGLAQNWPQIRRITARPQWPQSPQQGEVPLDLQGPVHDAQGRADSLPPARGFQAIVSGSCSAATLAQVQHFQQSG